MQSSRPFARRSRTISAHALAVTALLCGIVGARPADAQTYLTISPGSQATSSPTVTYTIDACSVAQDVYLRPAMARVLLDGVNAARTSTLPVTDANCFDAYQITGTITLVQFAANRLTAQFPTLGGPAGVDTAVFDYRFVKPVITSADPMNAVNPGVDGSKEFTITNGGNIAGMITLSSGCSTPLSGCAALSPSSVVLNPQEQRTVIVPLHAAIAGGTSTMTWDASAADISALTDHATRTVLVNTPVSFVKVDPDSNYTPNVIPGVMNAIQFRVGNWYGGGGNYQETVSLQPTCTVNGSSSSCSMTNGATTLVLGPILMT